MKRIPLAIVALVPLLALACTHDASRPSSGATSTSAPHAVVEFARVADAGETTVVKTVTYKGSELRLAEVRHFAIATASPSQDSEGFPALVFEIAPADNKAFSDWTESILHKAMVVLLDGEPLMMVTVQSRLSGGGQIIFGNQHRTPKEVRALADRIVDRR